ncbi:MAG: crosslink repair DNA glycosylase YcaQ family protein [Kineosporiaceae bacterium]
MRHLDRVLDRIAVLQIDSVNVLVRSHYLPVFSRLGPYPRALLDRAANSTPRRLVEYWAHQASFTAPATHRLLGFRMERAAQEAWAGLRRLAQEHPGLLDGVRAVVEDGGPLTSAEIETILGRRVRAERIDWGWNWSEAKMAVEYLFRGGALASAGRTSQFERRYDLPDRVLPGATPGLSAGAVPDEETACRELVAIAARAHGVGTEACLRDYFRLTGVQSRRAVAELVEEGRLVPVTVAGWRRPAYLDPAARIPTRLGGSALLSPFDSLVWFRERTEQLFGVRYRIEIYTPAPRRVYGYYVLPFLLGDRLVARVDLKADRAAGVLAVRAAWLEGEQARGRATPGAIAAALAADLTRMATWLGLSGISVRPHGDLAAELAAELATA